MTTVNIESGICGFCSLVRVSKGEGRRVGITIKSDCKQITALDNALEELEMKDILKTPINQNPIYERAGECNLHTSCPVPCGVVKAAEVELGLALKKDVRIEFREDD